MECKDQVHRSRERRDEDLIDTLWNVKQDEKLANSQCAQDLIDTLWNVKSLRAHRELQREHLDLIDTLWNVKEDQSFKN